MGWFNRVNAVRVRLESQFTTTLTPFIVTVPPPDGTDVGSPFLSFSVVAATGVVTAVLDPTILALWDDDPNAILGAWASTPQSSARQSAAGVRGRIFAFEIGDSTTPITSPLTLTLPVGHPRPAAGQAVFLRGWLSLPNGRATYSRTWFRAIAS